MIELPTLTYELLMAATGNQIVVRTLDGQEVLLRLATPDEALRFNAEGRAAVAELLGEPAVAPAMTQDQAEQQTRALRWPL